jgi:hypothetical protein
MTDGGTPMPPFEASALNRAVDARYAACRAAGTHRPGPRWTLPRPVDGGEGAPAAICSTCGVPLPGPNPRMVQATNARKRAGTVTARAWNGGTGTKVAAD